MTEHNASSPEPDVAPARRCPHSWCTTPHGATLHPDDEAHRSEGVAMEVVLRGPDNAPRPVDAELGVLRRTDDDETWVVLEIGARPALAVTVETARRLRDALFSDPMLRRALDGP